MLISNSLSVPLQRYITKKGKLLREFISTFQWIEDVVRESGWLFVLSAFEMNMHQIDEPS